MKKILGLFVILFMFVLTGCLENSYSSDSLKSNLEKNGYTVQVDPIITNIDKDKLEGLKSVLYAYNKDGGILFFVFDKIENVEKLTQGNTVSETVSMIMRWGKDNAKDDNSEFGSANNVLYSGDKDARKASGIKLASD
jgi:hypothetical protein